MSWGLPTVAHVPLMAGAIDKGERCAHKSALQARAPCTQMLCKLCAQPGICSGAHHGEVCVDQALQRAAQVHVRAAGAGGVAAAHLVQAGVLHQQHRIRAHRLIELPNANQQHLRGERDKQSWYAYTGRLSRLPACPGSCRAVTVPWGMSQQKQGRTANDAQEDAPCYSVMV